MAQQLTDQAIGDMLSELYREYAPHMTRLRVRRLLLEIGSGAGDAGVGTYLPEPYDQSKLIIRQQIGDVIDTLDNFTARVSANEPRVVIEPLSIKQQKVGKTVERNAADQEQVLMAMWGKLGGRYAQRQVTRSACWGRAGWYLTLPRDASFGLPDRDYFDDLTDDEIERMRRSGKIKLEAEPDGSYAESADSWMERRRDTARQNAIDGPSLLTLAAYPPDMVYTRWMRDGTARPAQKYSFIVEELPRTEFMAGSELAKSAGKLAGLSDDDAERYGLMVRDGKIEGGIAAGGEEGSQQNQHWTLATLLTPNEVYYYVTETPGGGGGRTVYYDEHGAGRVPLVPAPAIISDSGAPGSRFSSLMESVFAQAPIINQIETLLSNVATWNALGRFVIVDESGRLLEDPDTGEPMIMASDDLIGGEPGKVAIVKGQPQQLVLDASLLFQLLDFYSARMDLSKPSPVTEGVAGASSAAWQVRQLLEASGELIEQAVDNHSEAVHQVMLLWVRWLRMLDEPIYVFAAPGRRGSERSVRGLIEFNPSDLTEAFTVHQSPRSAQQRIVLQQAGIELLQAGRIDDRQYYEEYALADDPEEAELRALVQQVKTAVYFQNTANLQPGSLLADLVEAVRGRVAFDLLSLSPNYALATAQQMTQRAAAASAPIQVAQPEDGNVAEAAGIRQPGLGMGQQLPGNPGARTPQVA